MIQLIMFPTKEDAFEAFEAHRPDWLTEARDCAMSLGQYGATVTIDDVRELCPPPPDADPRIMGAVFKSKQWKKVGRRSSRRRECHHRPVAIFMRRFG